MTSTPESIADLIAAHRDGAVSTLALYDKLRFLAAGCATLEKERDELERDKAAILGALVDVTMTERLRDLAAQQWASAQEDKRHISTTAYEIAMRNNSSANEAHTDARNKARAIAAASMSTESKA